MHIQNMNALFSFDKVNNVISEHWNGLHFLPRIIRNQIPMKSISFALYFVYSIADIVHNPFTGAQNEKKNTKKLD